MIGVVVTVGGGSDGFMVLGERLLDVMGVVGLGERVVDVMGDAVLREGGGRDGGDGVVRERVLEGLLTGYGC